MPLRSEPIIPEETGMMMIIALQNLVGRTETEEEARTAWRSFSKNGQWKTVLTYAQLIGMTASEGCACGGNCACGAQD